MSSITQRQLEIAIDLIQDITNMFKSGANSPMLWHATHSRHELLGKALRSLQLFSCLPDFPLKHQVIRMVVDVKDYLDCLDNIRRTLAVMLEAVIHGVKEPS